MLKGCSLGILATKKKGLGFVLGYIKDMQNSTKLIGERTYRGEDI